LLKVAQPEEDTRIGIARRRKRRGEGGGEGIGER